MIYSLFRAKKKKLIEEGDEESQTGRKKKSKKRKKKPKKVKKKHRELDEDEKDRDELEIDMDSDDDDFDRSNKKAKLDDDFDDDDIISENKANSKLDVGPIATADYAYYESEADSAGKSKNKPLVSARGQGRPTSCSKPAKFNFIETDQRKASKRARGGIKNVLFVRSGTDNATDILLNDLK